MHTIFALDSRRNISIPNICLPLIFTELLCKTEAETGEPFQDFFSSSQFDQILEKLVVITGVNRLSCAFHYLGLENITPRH